MTVTDLEQSLSKHLQEPRTFALLAATAAFVMLMLLGLFAIWYSLSTHVRLPKPALMVQREADFGAGPQFAPNSEAPPTRECGIRRECGPQIRATTGYGSTVCG